MKAVDLPKVGDLIPSRTFGPITRTDIVRYAGASGDFNPIHHDEGVATAAGYPSVFSIGMLQAGLLATCVTDWLGADAVGAFSVQFRKQVWPGDVLTCSGSVKSVERDGDMARVVLSITCDRDSEAVMTGEAEFNLDAE